MFKKTTDLYTQLVKVDAFAKTHGAAKQKFCPTRPGGYSGEKAYMWYVDVLKKHCNAVEWTFGDAIKGG